MQHKIHDTAHGKFKQADGDGGYETFCPEGERGAAQKIYERKTGSPAKQHSPMTVATPKKLHAAVQSGTYEKYA